MNLARESIPEFLYHPSYIAKSLSRKRLGGVCGLNLCGHGETLLPKEIVGIINALLKEGHYVFVVTNGTIDERFDEIVKLPSWRLKRLFFKFSFHYQELLRLGLMNDFVLNIEKVKKGGCSYSIEITPYDELIPYIEEIKIFCIKNFGAECHVTVARDNAKMELPILTDLSREDYHKTWASFNSALFEYKLSVFNAKQDKYCHGGELTSSLDLMTGDLKQCYSGDFIQNIYKNAKELIQWKAIGEQCPESHCYNAHAFLTFGSVPELNDKTPTYADMRNRICTDGSEWLTPKMKKFMNQKI
jgi:hypothetical protein